MSTGGLLLVILLAAALIAVSLVVWNARQRGPAGPQRRHRDLDVRIDSVVAGARDVADRAARLATPSEASSIVSEWPPVRTDMLAVEGDTVSLAVHVGEAPVGHSLAELDRTMHAMRDSVDRHVELVAAAPGDEHALELSQDAVAERRRDVEAALDQVGATRP